MIKMHLDVDLTAAVISFLVAFLVSAVSGRFLFCETLRPDRLSAATARKAT